MLQGGPQSSGSQRPWKENQLFPDGWEQLSPFEKAGELWSGQRGALFWANKIAYASVFVLIGGWIVFRFVGPALGLYTLTADLSMPES